MAYLQLQELKTTWAGEGFQPTVKCVLFVLVSLFTKRSGTCPSDNVAVHWHSTQQRDNVNVLQHDGKRPYF